MSVISKVFDLLTRILLWTAVSVSILMMLAIVVGVAFRYTGNPIIGNVEIVEILLIFLIASSLAYTQSLDMHIKIGIIVDHFPKWAQSIIDAFGYIATALLCFIIAHVFFKAGLYNFNVSQEYTMAFQLPVFILKLVISLGFLLWGLEAINRMIKLYLVGNEEESA